MAASLTQKHAVVVCSDPSVPAGALSVTPRSWRDCSLLFASWVHFLRAVYNPTDLRGQLGSHGFSQHHLACVHCPCRSMCRVACRACSWAVSHLLGSSTPAPRCCMLLVNVGLPDTLILVFLYPSGPSCSEDLLLHLNFSVCQVSHSNLSRILVLWN